MATYKVLITDYAWPTLEIEKRILAAVGADLLVAETGDEAELIRLAPQADAILTCWKPVTKLCWMPPRNVCSSVVMALV